MGQHYVGLDVWLEMTAVCVLDEAGAIVWRGKVSSTPEALAAAIHARAPQVARIGLETGPLCTWHWHALRALGLPIVCLDARHAKAALSLRLNKIHELALSGQDNAAREFWRTVANEFPGNAGTMESMVRNDIQELDELGLPAGDSRRLRVLIDLWTDVETGGRR